MEFLRYYHVADEAVEMVETNDGGIVILGNGVDAKGFSHLTLLKVSENGEFTWESSVEEDGYSWIGRDLIQTSDDGFAIAASRWNASEEGDATLVKVDSKGDTLWTRKKLREESDSLATFFTGDSVFYIDSKGIAVAENGTGDLIFLLEAYSRKKGMGAVIDQYDFNGDSAAPSAETFGFGISLLSVESSIGLTSIYFKWDIFGEKLLGIYCKEETEELSFVDIITNHYGFYRDFGENEPGNSYEGGNISMSESGSIFAVGTVTSLGDNRPHLYAIKTNAEGDRIWEHVDTSAERSWGHFIVPTHEGGAIAVGAQQKESNQNLYVVEIKPEAAGLDNLNYIWEDEDTIVGVADTSKTFTYGSELDPETARAILVTHDDKWLILGDHSYFGQGGIWLLKIDPSKL